MVKKSDKFVLNQTKQGFFFIIETMGFTDAGCCGGTRIWKDLSYFMEQWSTDSY